MLVTPVSFPPVAEARCVSVAFREDFLSVILEDGRVLEVPLECYPRLAAASPSQLADWRLIGGGMGIHWPAIDEDISVAELLGGSY
jgi:hypothetical protein